MRSRRRAQSGVIAAIFIVLILFVGLGFLFNLFVSFSSYQDSVLQRGQEDVRRQQTSVRILDVFFGSMASSSGQASSTASAHTTLTQVFPVSNMNFTTGAQDWFFTRSFEDPCVYFVCSGLGGWTTELPTIPGVELVVSSKSGPGLISDIFTFSQLVARSDTVRVKMNWTTSFDLDPQIISGVSSALLNWSFLARKGAVWPGSCGLFVVLVRPDGKNFILDQVPKAPNNDVIEDTDLDICDNLVTNQFAFRTVMVRTLATKFDREGRYHLAISFVLVAPLRPTDTRGSMQVFLDDVGLSITLRPATTYVADFDLAVPSGVSNPLLLERVIFDVTSRATAPVYHWIYLRDFSLNGWVLVDGTIARVEEFTTRVDIASPNARNFVDSTGNARVRVHAVGFEPFTLTLTVSTTSLVDDRTRVTLFIENRGSVMVHLVSLYISGGGAFIHLDVDPTAPGVSGRFDIWLSPGERVVLPIPFNWQPGTEYRVTVTTENGVVASGIFRAR
jgi:hypothetical protein